MSTKKTIAKSFTVSTIEDGVSVQAQYAPNANPTSGQIHTVWQEGDLYMRTRESDSSAWSAWHKIVGESGDETDYTFGISQYRTTENAQTAPSDISSWSDAPLAVTTAKPYLWSKVQQKSWNESTQQYVVDSTRYIRLTGEEGVVYDIQTPVDSIHIGENQTSATLSGTAKFYKKEGTKDKVQTVFYYGIYKRTGTTFEKVATGNANSYTFNALSVANTVNAIVIYLFASSYTETSPETQTYLVKREMMVVDAGNSPYFADLDNEMDSIACANDGKPSSEQTVETNVKLYRGSTALSPTLAVNDDSPSGAAYTNGTAKDGITVTWNNTTGNIKFKFGTSNSRTKTETFCITLTVTDNGATITRYLYFTVNCIRAALDGNPAALYRLTPSVNEIVKKKDGTYVPTGNTYITCGVTKNVGGTQSTPSASEYTLKYSLNGGAETTYTATSVKANQVTSNLVFILYVNSVVVDRETIGLVTDGTDGTSPYFADLDNEMDSVSCNKDGVTTSAQTVVSYASMWKGNTKQTITGLSCKINGKTLSTSYNTDGYRFSYVTSTGYCEIGVNTGITIATKVIATITITATIDGVSVSRDVELTINGARQGANGEPAAIYKLIPSDAQIVKKKDGTYTPSGNITCSVTKNVGGTSSTPSSSEYTLKMKVNGGSEQAYAATAASSITSKIEFILYVNSVVVDRETVPLVSDGDKGNAGSNAPYIELSRSTIIYKANNDGQSISSQDFPITYALKVKGNTCTISSVNDITITLPTNVTVKSGTKTTSRCTINCAHSVVMSGVITITITGTYNDISYTATGSITVSDSREGRQGEQGDPGSPGGPGPRGKVGRFFYYAGAWNDFASTDSFLVNDAQAPYFYYDNNYWVFNPETNGTYTKQDMGTPSSSSSNWKLMTSDFKYIITEAIFGAYAHLGSFIINKDWMLSQYGVLVDSSGTETKVDGIVLYGNNVHSGTIIVRVQFATSGTASITATASSEGGYDKGYVKNSGGSTLIEVSGTQSDTVNQSVSSGGYIDLSYTKDGSMSSNDDKITFNISGVGYTLSLVSATSGMTYTGSGVILSAPYTYFDPSDPMVSTTPSSGYKFRPNVAIDGLTGKTYQNDAYVKGTVKASKYYQAKQTIPIRGTSVTKDIEEGIQIVEVQSQSTSTNATNYVRLPDATNNAGMVVDIYLCRGIQTAGYNLANLTVTAKNGNLVNLYTWLSQTGYPTLSTGQHVKVYSNGSSWIVLEDNDSRVRNIISSSITAEEATINDIKATDYVALPSNLMTHSFTLPESPRNGMMIFCKGISAQLTVTTRGHAIMNRNDNDNWCNANSSATISDSDSVILVFSSAAGKWLYFSCE